MPSSRSISIAHLLGPRLAAEVPGGEPQGARVAPPGAGHLGDVERVARRADQHVGAQVGEERHLAGRVAAGHGHDGRAHPLDALVQPEAAGEEAVAEGHVHQVVGPEPAGHQEAGAQPRPDLHVGVAVGHEGGLAGGSRRPVDPRDLGARHGQHAERVARPQVVLGGEREPLQVVEGADVRRGHAGPREGRVVEGGDAGAGHRPAQPFQLELRQPVAGQELRRVPDAALGRGHHAGPSGSDGLEGFLAGEDADLAPARAAWRPSRGPRPGAGAPRSCPGGRPPAGRCTRGRGRTPRRRPACRPGRRRGRGPPPPGRRWP